jgi:hypothetical protein
MLAHESWERSSLECGNACRRRMVNSATAAMNLGWSSARGLRYAPNCVVKHALIVPAESTMGDVEEDPAECEGWLPSIGRLQNISTTQDDSAGSEGTGRSQGSARRSLLFNAICQ